MVTVTVDQGKLKGGESESDNGKLYYEFLGIPYAKPPIGNLRFRNPQAPEPWDGVRDATNINEANVCCQVDIIKNSVIGSEDCLYLNVYTPNLRDSNTKLLPVMVFIHGGGFKFTNGIVKQDLGPDYLIDNDVIVVTLNYRLGVLGFLSLGIPEATGNMGLKDQVIALKWIKNNIPKFGGDKNNVTIFGISAGSASVEHHILSPLSKGLFHKAILQSGSSINHWAINYEPEKLNEKLLEQMGYKGSMQDDRAKYEYLVSSPISELIEASYNVSENFISNRIYFGFVPTIEQDFNDGEAMITEYPYKLFEQGRFNRVPVIKGFCDREGYLSSLLRPKSVIDLIEKKNFTDHWAFSLDANDKIVFDTSFLEAYTENIKAQDENDKIGVDFFTDFDFVAGICLTANMMASKGVPVYMYEFCYEGKNNFFKNFFGMMRKGASHGDDMCYVFKHTISGVPDTTDDKVRENLTKMWANFAKTSNPTPSDTIPVQWPNYSEDTQTYLSIKEDFVIKNLYEPKKIAIFKQILEKYEK